MSQPPNLLQGPEPVETADLHFKQYCKLKIFEPQAKYEDGHCNLITVSQYYGLIFARNLNGFSVIKAKSINPTTDPDLFPRRDIALNFKTVHMSVDFSQKILAVVCLSPQGAMLLLYNIASFSSKDVMPMKITSISNLVQNLAAEVSDMQWQPNADGGLTFCMTDGSILMLSQPTADGGVFNLPNTTQATCFCWSPKGKQIVIGSVNGTLSQYKPNLKIVKTLPAPPLFNGAVMVVNVLWISSYQFAVAYNDRNSPESFPLITIVNAAKNEPVNVINYDDITYSSTLFRNHQIYMSQQSAWNLIFVSSANSMEVAVLHSKDGVSWEQWLLGDASRAELPLNPDRQETFPLGWAFDFTSQEAIPWGEGTLPPMPRLLLLSDEGLLCIYNIINLTQNAPTLCEPPKDTLDDSLFIVPNALPPVLGLVPQLPLVTQAPLDFLAQTSSSFGNLKPSYSFGSLAVQPQITVPQVTTSIQGGPVLGGVKDGQLTLQQTQAPQQLSLFQQEQTVAPLTQAPPTTNTFKFSSSSQFGVSSTPMFGASTTNSLFAAKATAASENAAFTKFSAPQGSIFTVKPAAPPEDLFASKTSLQSTPTKPLEVGPENVTNKSASPNKADEIVEVTKTEIPGKVKSPGGSPEPATPEYATVDDSVYWNALQEEIDHFNSELQQLSARVGTLDIEVGTQADKTKMKESIDVLNGFWKELKETTDGQKSEIHSVVMDLMESFAWLEDAKSRNLQRKNSSYIELKKSEELDPLSARHMSEISHLKYYIENQLKQLTSYLEKEWMDHQESYRVEVKNRMVVPPLEEVYKTMHLQLKILNRQRTLVEELKENIAMKKRRNKSQAAFNFNSSSVPSSSNDARVSELSKLAENLLQLKINREANSAKSENWEVLNSQLKAISERSKKLTQDKQRALKDALSERDMVKIRPVKTTFESSSFLRSLPLEKSVSKPKLEKKSPVKDAKPNAFFIQNTTTPSAKVISPPKESQNVRTESSEKESNKSGDSSKSVFVFGVPLAGKPIFPSTEQSFPTKLDEPSPLASLSGIVSSIGKENETKPKSPFVFGTPTGQKQEVPRETVHFSSVKADNKPEEAKTFSFGLSKSESPKFGAKLTFGTTSTPVITISTKPEVTKTPVVSNVSVTAAVSATTTAVPASTLTFPFTFAPSTTASSTPLPKMNVVFSAKDQSPLHGSQQTKGILFTPSSTSAQTSSVSIFSSSTPLFGTAGSKTFGAILETPATSVVSVPKTSADIAVQSTDIIFPQTSNNKQKADVTLVTPKKSENEEADVTETKKPETIAEVKEKDSPKVTISPGIFGSNSEPLKTVVVTSSVTPLNIQVATTNQSTISSTENILTKPVTTIPATEISTISSSATTTKTAATSPASVFSFSSTSPIFGGTPTTTAVTNTTSVFGQGLSSTSTVFGQVSSTTPTTNIFGSATPATPTSSIFGSATPTDKPVFAQSLTPSTTSSSIFGTSTTNTFAQSSPPAFGQKPDAVGQTANIFSQLLSDSSRSGSVFGTSSGTPTTSGNIFSSSKNIFGGSGVSTTTTSVFGGTTSSPLFSQTTTVFGQPTTSSSIFGQSQPQTSTSNSFFGQNICSPFGSGSSVTSHQNSFGENGGFNNKPVFGQSLFGKTTNNTSIFGGASSPPSFGGSCNSGNSVFHTPTTSSTFGSTTSGPFSSSQGSVAETGFGAASSATFSKPLGGFGSPPLFGSPPAPAFGSSPTFGGSASFGAPSTFGSRPFDTSATTVQGTFGQTSGHSTTFENLANQNTVGFGNLAQQSQNQSFGGGVSGIRSSSFENKPAFGGNSFSSWRS